LKADVAKAEEERARIESEIAEAEKQKAEAEEEARKLRQLLQAHGIDPDAAP
jgi:chromosome segregation ATPase